MKKSRDYDSLAQKLVRLLGADADPSQASGRLRRFMDLLVPNDTQSGARVQQRELLAEVIDQEIIPRLLAAHDGAAQGEPATTTPHSTTSTISLDQIEHFTDLCLASDPTLAHQYVQTLMHDGLTKELVLLELITESARDVGRRWVADRLNFAEVSLACVRSHEIIHQLRTDEGELPLPIPPNTGGRALFASAPGSRHILGAVMVAEFFNDAGWHTRTMLTESHDQLIEVVANDFFDVIGLSIAIDSHLEGLKELVAALRSTSKNPHVSVFLGGPTFLPPNDYRPAQFDADAICLDPRITVTLAELSKFAQR